MPKAGDKLRAHLAEGSEVSSSRIAQAQNDTADMSTQRDTRDVTQEAELQPRPDDFDVEDFMANLSCKHVRLAEPANTR